MNKLLYLFLFLCVPIGCKQKTNTTTFKDSNISAIKLQTIQYASGFTIDKQEDYTIITVNNPWQKSEKSFSYLLLNKNDSVPENTDYDAIIRVPVEKMVVTSTTHIPSLEMLGVENSLIGFPNLDYISSKKTRDRIENGLIAELGKNEDLNTELLLDLKPDAVVSFGVSGKNKTLDIIKQSGIPVLYNGDWMETSPLGKAEWIKFFGALFNKSKEADSVFSEIKSNYLKAKKLALNAKKKPTVLSGSLFKDIWYAPAGTSWAAQFINDAGGDYLWKNSKGSGSLQLSIESVLEKGIQADFWIGPGYAKNLSQMAKTHPVYEQFDAFKNKNVYGFTNKTGKTGGVLYFELGPNRPDLILKDLIKILHPELLPNYELTFFNKFE